MVRLQALVDGCDFKIVVIVWLQLGQHLYEVRACLASANTCAHLEVSSTWHRDAEAC